MGINTFINAITRKNACKVSGKGVACTNDIKFVSASFLSDLFVFIDTPGLNDGKGDEKNISTIKKASTEFPRIQNIIILLRFHDKRLTQSLKNSIKEFMRCLKEMKILKKKKMKSKDYF